MTGPRTRLQPNTHHAAPPTCMIFLTCKAVTRSSGCRDPRPFDPIRYKSRNIIERSFNRLKDWRGIATRNDKTARNFLADICLASAVTHWVR